MAGPRFPKSALNQGGGSSHYGNVKRKMGGEPTDTSGKGSRARGAHPNGGETNKMKIPDGKMPRDMGMPPVTHTDLAVDHGKMPRNMSGGRERDPHRR